MKLRILGLLFCFPMLSHAHDLVTRVIDTNAGHASITSIPGGHYMVFDAGRSAHADHIIKQLKEVVVGDTIDLPVISHTDGDHLGAIEEIFNNYTVKTVFRLG